MCRLGPVIAALGLLLFSAVDTTSSAATGMYNINTVYDHEGTKVVVEDLTVPGNPEQNPGFFQGDIALPRFRNAAAINQAYLKWPNGVVYYEIHSSYSSSVRQTIIAAMRELESDTWHGKYYCVNFQPRRSRTIYYVTILPQTGCHSPLGRQRHGYVSIGKGCEYKGIIMHELLHTLGFDHEQSRYDRDEHVKINLANVESSMRANFDKVPTKNTLITGTHYDFSSLMHYGPYDFAKDPAKPTVKIIGGYSVGVHMGQRLRLSAEDVSRVQKMYNCVVDISHITMPAKKDLIVDCNFENDTSCELTQDHTGDFLWQKNSGSTLTRWTGPHGDHTNGIGSYYYAEATRHYNQVCRLKSPIVPKGDACVSLQIYNYGSQAGVFSIIVEGPLIPRQSLAQYQGGKSRRGWQWVRLNVFMTEAAHFYLQYRVGSGPYSDMAIDDVQIYRGECTAY